MAGGNIYIANRVETAGNPAESVTLVTIVALQ